MTGLPNCPPGPHLHSVSEVCALIGCDSEEWFVERVRGGEFPSRRVVRQLRFSDADIAAIIDACMVAPRRVGACEPLRPTSRRRAS